MIYEELVITTENLYVRNTNSRIEFTKVAKPTTVSPPDAKGPKTLATYNTRKILEKETPLLTRRKLASINNLVGILDNRLFSVFMQG